ncbi:nod factor hydrolase protein 1-like [Gastrolobium bilobum]|uniref:nod factor hydrolase protein 1-like n=1 Tax=Gastrolobium bilobum TaxID=150636 RepID=UPI002AB2E065|nr:nod factor hydrolase protein 1-like [Gastrolobium bilobum]
MASLNLMKFLSLAFLLAVATSCSTGSTTAVKGLYWLDNPVFPSSAIDTSLFTHVYYAFIEPNNVTYKLDISNSTATTLTTFTNSFLINSVKTLISIGGSNTAAIFANIASNVTTRATFINSTIDVARTFGFDGVDLDWEFPRSSNEMNDLAQLFQEWRHAIAVEASAAGRPPLLLTAAVYFAVDFFLSGTPRTYPVASINQNLDWVNVMSYDLHGSWENKTGAPSALFDPKSNVSVAYGLQSWIRVGALPQKMVMGLVLYGRTWQLQDPSVHGIGAPAVGSGPGLDGAMAFFQVLDFKNETGANVVYDVETLSVYCYNGSSWIGYDDPLTVTVKVGFAQSLSLRGYFFWAAGYDSSDWKISTQASKAWILA